MPIALSCVTPPAVKRWGVIFVLVISRDNKISRGRPYYRGRAKIIIKLLRVLSNFTQWSGRNGHTSP